MDLSFSWSIECIGVAHPMLWFSIGIASIINWFTGAGAAWVWYSVKDVGRRVVYLGPIILGLACVAAASAYVTLLSTYRFVSDGSVCVHYVWPFLLIPLPVAVASFIRVSRRFVPTAA